MDTLKARAAEYFYPNSADVVTGKLYEEHLVCVIGGGNRIVAAGKAATLEEAAACCLAALEEWRNQ